MNNKFALAISFLIFNLALPVLADDTVQEIVITGTQNTGGNTSSYSQPTETPVSTSGPMYGSGYGEAMAQKAAAEEKGRRLGACYEKLASLDKSKYACSEDGELIDVVEVTGVKDNDVSQGYAEQDALRPEPIFDPAQRPKPQMCYTLSQDLFNCEQRAFRDFTRNSYECSYDQRIEDVGGFIANFPVVGDVLQSISAAISVGAGYLVGDCGIESPQTTQDMALSVCRYEDRENTAYCAKNWPNQ